MPSPVDADRLAYSYINLLTLAISALHSEPSPLRLWRRPDGLLHRAWRSFNRTEWSRAREAPARRLTCAVA